MYALLPRYEWDNTTPNIHECGGCILVDASAVHARVDALSGRDGVLRIPSVARKLRSGGRVYVAPARGCYGWLVQRVPGQERWTTALPARRMAE